MNNKENGRKIRRGVRSELEPRASARTRATRSDITKKVRGDERKERSMQRRRSCKKEGLTINRK